MRVGTHDCFDRFVLQLQGIGPEPGWTVGYRAPLIEDPSGRIVDLRGAAELEVIVRAWTVVPYPAMPAEWMPFEGPTRILPEDFPVLREVRYLTAFEGVTQFGIGVDRRHPFRVMWLRGPDRLVVDIAHR